jgi:hypothetical protein
MPAATLAFDSCAVSPGAVTTVVPGLQPKPLGVPSAIVSGMEAAGPMRRVAVLASVTATVPALATVNE